MGTLVQGLTGIMGQLTGIHAKTGEIHGRFHGLGLMLGTIAITGGLAAFAKVVKDIVKDTGNLTQEWSKLEQMGLKPGEMDRVKRMAIDQSIKIPGMTEVKATGLYSSIRDLFSRKPEEAFEVMPELLKFAQVFENNALKHGKTSSPEETERTIRALVRSAEQLGQMQNTLGELDVGKFLNFLDVANKINTGTHGAVTPQQLLGIAQMGGAAFTGVDNHGLYAAAVLAQQMGGAKFGTAQMSLFQQFAGGTMTARKAEGLEELGLLHKGKWHASRGGAITIDPDEQKQLSKILEGGDAIKMGERLKKAMEDHGIKGIQEQVLALFRFLGRSTTQREMADVIRSLPQLQAEMGTLEKGQGVGEALATSQNSIPVALNNISSAITNLYTAIGEDHAGTIVNFLDSFRRHIDLFTAAARAYNHDDIDKFYESLSKASGIDVKTLKETTAELNQFGAALKWIHDNSTGGDAIYKGANAAQYFNSIIDSFPTLLNKAVDALSSGLNGVADAIMGFIARLWNQVRGLLGIGPSAPTGHPDYGGLPHPEAPAGHGAPREQHSSFLPPPQDKKAIIVHTALNLDGATLARAVEQQIAELHELPDSASSSNGVAFNTLNDWNPRDQA